MLVSAIKTRRFQIGENLSDFILEHVPTLREDSILVITSKIISLAQNRLVEGGWDERKNLVDSESEWSVEDEWGFVSCRDGMLVGSAGIDQSNGFGKLILLPRDCYTLAKELYYQLQSAFDVQHFGIIITDSRTIPLRYGAIGQSLGHFGFDGIRNYVGTEDLDGREIKLEKSNVVDALAAAAVNEMGETDEMRPLCVIEDAYVRYSEEDVDTGTIVVPFAKDRFFRIIDKIKEKIGGFL